MYTVVCDNCGENIGASQDYSCWADDSYAEENAIESDWEKINGKHYCPACFKRNDKDELVIIKKSAV